MTRSDRRRRSTRLREFDYAGPGVNFVTVCTCHRQCLLGNVYEGGIALSRLGLIVQEEWLQAPQVRADVSLDEYVIMPNHIHGLIILQGVVGATRRVAPTTGRSAGPPPGSLGAIIGQFKSRSAKRANAVRRTPGAPLWQRNYYDHVIRSETNLPARGSTS